MNHKRYSDTDPPASRIEVAIDQTWNGVRVSDALKIEIDLSPGPRHVTILVRAPYFGNPPPPSPPGPTDRLWEHDVVEVFLLGRDECYLEVELGPHGHYLGLMLEGRRRIKESLLPLDYTANIAGGRWTGRADIPNAYLPDGLFRWNAYGIFTVDGKRKHLALFPLGGDAPDFHRLENFGVFP